MRSKTYYPIVWHQDWHSGDRLNDIALCEGAKIEVKWPNSPRETSDSRGTSSRGTSAILSVHEITIIKETHVVSDMGHPYECTDNISQITINHNNAEVVMRLRDTKEILARFVD